MKRSGKLRDDVYLPHRAHEIVEALERGGKRLVLAESCTSGMVAAFLGSVPGVSDYFCGSAVTYRDATKQAWLQIPKRVLKESGAVSRVAAQGMAEGALANTPEADVAASVTGHLGPNAPAGLDGVIFVGLAYRRSEGVVSNVKRWRLSNRSREGRQWEAAIKVLAAIKDFLARVSSKPAKKNC